MEIYPVYQAFFFDIRYMDDPTPENPHIKILIMQEGESVLDFIKQIKDTFESNSNYFHCVVTEGGKCFLENGEYVHKALFSLGVMYKRFNRKSKIEL